MWQIGILSHNELEIKTQNSLVERDIWNKKFLAKKNLSLKFSSPNVGVGTVLKSSVQQYI